MISKEEVRIEKIVKEAISKFNLNLTGLVVLTEAASGYYVYTPIVAALSGGEAIAFAKDTKYGKKIVIEKNIKKIARRFKIEKNIRFIDKLTPKIISSADIVTNSGLLRPIDEKFIDSMKKTAVIPVMYELWELRKTDIDIPSALKKKIAIVGTNEDAPGLEVFDFVKPLILKTLFEAGLEIYQNNFLLISADKFGRRIKEILEDLKCQVYQLDPKDKIDLKNLPERFDGVILAAYDFSGKIPNQVIKKYPEAKIIRFINGDQMAKTFSELGPLPVINLHTASLKVAEITSRVRLDQKNKLELNQNKLVQLMRKNV